MSFASKSRKEAQAAQVNALNQQNAILQDNQRMQHEYANNFDTRNAGILGMQKGAQDWLDKFSKGTDVATLNPAYAQTASQAADTVTKSTAFASRFGDNATHNVSGDADYQAKLRSVQSANISKGLAQLNMQGLQDELGNQRGILGDTTSYLNADRQASFTQGAELANMASNVFANATTRRQIEINRSQAMMDNLFRGISATVQGVSAAFAPGAGFLTGGIKPPVGMSGANPGGGFGGGHAGAFG